MIPSWRRGGQNVLGGPLEPCGFDPVTGFWRDGTCRTGGQDVGIHAVCAVMTDEFLAFSASVGNDLSTPRPDWGFAGLARRRPLVPLRRPVAGGARGGRRASRRPRGDARARARVLLARRPRGARLRRLTGAQAWRPRRACASSARRPAKQCVTGAARSYASASSGSEAATSARAARDEGRLVHPVGDALGPLVQRLPEGGEVALDVVEDAEVDEGDAGGTAPLELVERPVPRLEVDLRRGRGGEDEPSGRDPHAERVAVVERPVVVQVGDLVGGVARGRDALEPEHVVAHHADVRLGHGRELAPELVEGVAVQAPRARLEPRRVDDVRRADLRDVDDQVGVLPHERPGRSGVVEVDVREEEVAQVAELDAAGRDRLAQRREAARRAAVEEREPVVRLDQVRGDPAGVPAVQEVERLGHREDATRR